MRKSLFLSLLFFLTMSVHARQQQPLAPVKLEDATKSSAPAVAAAVSSPTPEKVKVKFDDDKEKKVKKSEEKVGNSAIINSRFNLPPEKREPVRVPYFETPPVIDGKLDEAAWQQAATFKDFYQTAPGDNVAPSKPTVAYMAYDERHLYLAFHCFDDPEKVRATVAKRDSVFGEDNVRVWLDTYNDQRRAYVLGFNPLGIQQDGIYTEGQGADFSVDIVMESKGTIVADGWMLEVKIPFKSLRYSAGKGKLWGFNAARNIDRFNDEFDQWLPDDRNISGFLVKHGKLTGLENIKVERTLEIVPSITLSETGNRKRTKALSTLRAQGAYNPITNPTGVIDTGKFINDPPKADLGVNVKFNITPNITLDAAYNPDFAEIEADAPVVTANQRFPIFFQEKRPFFLEGVEIFQAPLQTFYSRTIVDPDVATKLTGKIGKTSFGFLVASDNAPGNYSEDERGDLIECQQLRAANPTRRCNIEEFLDKNALFGVLRLKRDIGKENNIGFFSTARTFPKNRNFTGGFDGRFKLNPKTVSQFQVVGTHSRKFFYSPDLNSSQYRTGNGVGYYWNIDYTEKNRGWFIEALGRSRDYRADSGFTRRTNTNTVFFANRLSTEPKPKARLIRVDWRQFARLAYDWKGRSQDGFVGTNFFFQLQGNLFVGTEMGVGYERLFEEEFGARRNAARPNQGAFFGASERSAYQPYANININKNFGKKLSAYGFAGFNWNNFDFDFGAGPRFPRVSEAYINYINSPEYQEFLRQRALRPNDPTLRAPDAPALDPGKGTQFDTSLGFTYKPVDPLNVSLDYTKSRLTRNDTGRTAFDTNIFTLRSTYQFTRFVFARTRIDYDTLSSNVRGQMLFGWNPNPGTALYVGYNDNFNYNGFNPFTGQLEPRFERNSRTFFIRASYLFRKSF
jgi:hypothetical protein